MRYWRRDTNLHTSDILTNLQFTVSFMLEWRQFLFSKPFPCATCGSSEQKIWKRPHSMSPFSVLKESYSDESIFIWFSGSLRRPLKGHLQFLGWIRTSIWFSWSSKSALGAQAGARTADIMQQKPESRIMSTISFCIWAAVWSDLMRSDGIKWTCTFGHGSIYNATFWQQWTCTFGHGSI